MEIQQVRAFLAVARKGGFVKAAEAICRTQPAVTSAVKVLEKELGLPLFERRGRRAILAPAGAALLEEAGQALQLWDGLKDRVMERLEGGARGTLRIGGGESSILYLLEILGKFQKHYPHVQIILHNHRAEDTLRMLKSGELDLGVRSLTSVPSWAIYRLTGECARLAVCAKKYPFAKVRGTTLDSLARYPLLFPGSQSITRIVVEDALSKAGLAYTVGPEAGGWEATKKFAMAGFGVAVVPSLCLTLDDRRQLHIRDASKLFGKDHYGIVIRRGAFLSKAAREFILSLDPKFSFQVNGQKNSP